MLRLLLVEDDPDFREDLAALLGQPGSGFEVAAAVPSAEDALDALERGLSPEVALVDLGLAGLSGIELIRLGKRASPATHFVAFTIFDDGPTVLSAFEAGASGYLLKSTAPSRLFDALRDAADGGSPLTASVARHLVERVAPKSSDPGVDELSPRELDVLTYLAKGISYGETARLLGIGLGTVQTHVKSIYKKLGVSSKAEAAAVAVRSGMA